MGTSVLQCKWCRKYYKEFFEDKRRMKLLARIHKNGHEQRTNENPTQTQSVDGTAYVPGHQFSF